MTDTVEAQARALYNASGNRAPWSSLTLREQEVWRRKAHEQAPNPTTRRKTEVSSTTPMSAMDVLNHLERMKQLGADLATCDLYAQGERGRVYRLELVELVVE